MVSIGENGWQIGFEEFLVIGRDGACNEPWEIKTGYANSHSCIYYTYYAVIWLVNTFINEQITQWGGCHNGQCIICKSDSMIRGLILTTQHSYRYNNIFTIVLCPFKQSNWPFHSENYQNLQCNSPMLQPAQNSIFPWWQNCELHCWTVTYELFNCTIIVHAIYIHCTYYMPVF